MLLAVNTMKLQYPHARLAVYNQLLLGRSCAEAIATVAGECGLQIESLILSKRVREVNCQAFDVAQEILAQQNPDTPQRLSARLAALIEQHQAVNHATSLIICSASNCVGLAPVILDLVLQSLDEAGGSLVGKSVIPMD